MLSRLASPRRERLFYLGLYSFVFAAAYLLGYEMEIPYHYYQYLDRVPLQQQLWSSLFYLHAQPPLPNLLLGLALKLEAAVGIAPAVSLMILHYLMGAGIVFCFHYLASNLVRNRVARHLLLLLLLFNPVFYSFLFLYFYTTHELFFLSLFFVAAYRYLQRATARRYALAIAAAVSLSYTRALFHFSWSLGVLLFLLLFARYVKGRAIQRHAILFVLAAAVLLLWPLKNQLQFGFFGYSSWQGYNLAQGVLARGVNSVYESPQAAAMPAAYRQIPVLAHPHKASGRKNWNYYPLIAYSQQLREETLARLRAQPDLLWKKVARNYREGYVLFSGRNPYEGGFDKRSTATPARYRWFQLYETVVYQYTGQDSRVDPVNGFYYLFPLIILLAGAKLWTVARSSQVEAATIALVFFTILFVTAVILLVDGAEGNRMRFPVEPYLFLLAAWLVPAGKQTVETHEA